MIERSSATRAPVSGLTLGLALALIGALGCGHASGTSSASDGSAGSPGAGGTGGVGGGTSPLDGGGVRLDGGGGSGGPIADARSDDAFEGGVDGGGTVACPTAMPKQAAQCPAVNSGFCYYGDFICYCYPQMVGSIWACGVAPPGCPKVVPARGSRCEAEGMRCSYDFRDCATIRSAATCQDGVWVFTDTPCS